MPRPCSAHLLVSVDGARLEEREAAAEASVPARQRFEMLSALLSSSRSWTALPRLIPEPRFCRTANRVPRRRCPSPDRNQLVHARHSMLGATQPQPRSEPPPLPARKPNLSPESSWNTLRRAAADAAE